MTLTRLTVEQLNEIALRVRYARSKGLRDRTYTVILMRIGGELARRGPFALHVVRGE